MTDSVPAEVFSPGEYLSDELEDRGWNQTDLAKILGRPAPLINQIIKGKRAITPDIAKELGAAFGTSALVWLNLEAAYRLHTNDEPVPSRIAERAKVVDLRARLRERYPVTAMARRGWIKSADDSASILKFFGVEAPEQEPRLAHAARKAGKADELTGAQLAWLYRVRAIANDMVAPKYSAEALRIAIQKLGSLRQSPADVWHVPAILNNAGVRFVIVETIANARIDGVCLWLKDDLPVIGMTLRHDRIDNFWFVLRHECEHVLREHGRSSAILDTDLEGKNAGTGPDIPEEERVANLAAADFCVPADRMNRFVTVKAPFFRDIDIRGFANTIGVHPGLVVGQVHHRTERYNQFRKYLVKVRSAVASSAVVDGWGEVYPMGS